MDLHARQALHTCAQVPNSVAHAARNPLEAGPNYAAHIWANLVPHARPRVLCSARPILHDSPARNSMHRHIKKLCPPAHRLPSVLASWALTACLAQVAHDFLSQLQGRMRKPKTKASTSLQLPCLDDWRWQMDPSAEDSQPANSNAKVPGRQHTKTTWPSLPGTRQNYACKRRRKASRSKHAFHPKAFADRSTPCNIALGCKVLLLRRRPISHSICCARPRVRLRGHAFCTVQHPCFWTAGSQIPLTDNICCWKQTPFRSFLGGPGSSGCDLRIY